MSQMSEGYIAEYNQLRAEIRMYLENSSRSLQIAVVLAAAAMTVGKDYRILPLVSAAIAAYLWYDQIRHFRAVQRVGSYLEVCVEPKVPGLNWETYGGDHPIQKSFRMHVIANLHYPTLMAAQALYGFHLYKPLNVWPPSWPGLGGIVIVIAIVIGCLLILSYRAVMDSRDTERGIWRGIQEKKESIPPKVVVTAQNQAHLPVPPSPHK